MDRARVQVPGIEHQQPAAPPPCAKNCRYRRRDENARRSRSGPMGDVGRPHQIDRAQETVRADRHPAADFRQGPRPDGECLIGRPVRPSPPTDCHAERDVPGTVVRRTLHLRPRRWSRWTSLLVSTPSIPCTARRQAGGVEVVALELKRFLRGLGHADQSCGNPGSQHGGFAGRGREVAGPDRGLGRRVHRSVDAGVQHSPIAIDQGFDVQPGLKPSRLGGQVVLGEGAGHLVGCGGGEGSRGLISGDRPERCHHERRLVRQAVWPGPQAIAAAPNTSTAASKPHNARRADPSSLRPGLGPPVFAVTISR